MKRILRSPWAIWAAVTLAAAFGLSKTGMFSATESIVLCALIYGVAVAGRFLPEGFTMAWPRKEIETRDGARDEVSQLAWLLFGRDARVSFGGMKHIRASARSVFESVGIDLNNPAHTTYVSSFLGPQIVSALVVSDETITQNQLKKLLTYLEGIEEHMASTPPPHIPAATIGDLS